MWLVEDVSLALSAAACESPGGSTQGLSWLRKRLAPVGGNWLEPSLLEDSRESVRADAVSLCKTCSSDAALISLSFSCLLAGLYSYTERNTHTR